MSRAKMGCIIYIKKQMPPVEYEHYPYGPPDLIPFFSRVCFPQSLISCVVFFSVKTVCPSNHGFSLLALYIQICLKAVK